MEIQANFTDDIEAGLAKFEAELVPKVLRAGAGAMSYVFHTEARLNAFPHIKTGTLYNAIYQVYADNLSDATKQVYRISWNRTKAPHGHLIEFGTSRAPAYPFMRPAFDHVGEAIAAGLTRMAEKMSESTP
jgi:HK97 gp10 family phage protein